VIRTVHADAFRDRRVHTERTSDTGFRVPHYDTAQSLLPGFPSLTLS
jgi:hypothetical protein